MADVRVHGDRIAAVAPHLSPAPGEVVRDEAGLALAPGFIDMHSHGDGGLLEDLDAGTIARQGVTSIFIGQDGESHFPLHDYYAQLAATPAAIGRRQHDRACHAARTAVMGTDLYRAATAAEVAAMRQLLAGELAAGAFGLSTGLEYEQAHFATTEEVIALSKVASTAGGFYISHVRDEADHVFDSPSTRSAHRARGACSGGDHPHQARRHSGVASGSRPHARLLRRRAAAHVDLTADVYPYTLTGVLNQVRVIIPDRDFFNAAQGVRG